MPDVITVLRDNVAITQVAGSDVLLAMAAAATNENALRAEAALAEIEDIASGAPDAPSILNKLDKDADLSDVSDPEAATENLQFLQAGTGALTRSVRSKLRERVSLLDFAAGDGETDDVANVQRAIDYIASIGGGTLDGAGRTYLLNSAGAVVDHDHVHLTNFIFKRTSTTPGFLLQFAKNNDTEGGGVSRARFIGVPTSTNGNGGLLFGSTDYKANRWTANDIQAESFAQYGMGISGGDGWRANGIRILEHGLTSGTIASCMGFYLFPRIASKGGQLSNLYSQISDACVANASANTAAVKLQTHNELTATNITAVYGSEEACVIDSIGGIVSNLRVRPQGTKAGLALTNQSSAHLFSGQTFILDGFEIDDDGAPSANHFLIGAGSDGSYSLVGCSIKNGRGGGAGYLAYSATKDCLFENLDFEDIRFDAISRGFGANSLPSTHNRYVNVKVRGGTSTGVLQIETTESVFQDCGVVAIDGDTVGTFQLRGSNNLLRGTVANNVSGSAITVIGDGNRYDGVTLGVVSSRSIWFQSGSDHNFASGNLNVGSGVLDSGSGNVVVSGVLQASATVNPASLAAGASTTTATLTVTGAALGDLVDASFSLDLAGARITAWVSAADTVSYYFTNVNGANPLDLASGTLKVRVRK